MTVFDTIKPVFRSKHCPFMSVMYKLYHHYSAFVWKSSRERILQKPNDRSNSFDTYFKHYVTNASTSSISHWFNYEIIIILINGLAFTYSSKTHEVASKTIQSCSCQYHKLYIITLQVLYHTFDTVKWCKFGRVCFRYF